MNGIYLIKKIEFDTSENKIENAISTEILGYVYNLHDVEQYITKPYYEGFDGEMYPQYDWEFIAAML